MLYFLACYVAHSTSVRPVFRELGRYESRLLTYATLTRISLRYHLPAANYYKLGCWLMAEAVTRCNMPLRHFNRTNSNEPFTSIYCNNIKRLASYDLLCCSTP